MGTQSKKISKLIRGTDRLRYQEDEATHPWLSILLDTYHILDIGISVEIHEEQKRRKDKLACHRGCSNCCLRPTVPVTEPEIRGIVWFISKKLPDDVREVVKTQILNHRNTTQCPFLVDSICAVYPLRPIACRIFFMFGAPCRPNEDVFFTRPNDRWTHSRDLGLKVALTILPLFGITVKQKKKEAFENGYLYDNTTLMHKLPWENIYSLIMEFDQNNRTN